MTPALEKMPWLSNTLLDDRYVEQKAVELALAPIPYDLPTWFQANFDAEDLARSNEAQLEDNLIAPLLTQLGWTRVPKQSITVQGKLAIPDWCLLNDAAKKGAFQAQPDPRDVSAICEAKAWTQSLDTGKADRKDNPHHQLQDYLSTLRVRYGFLTNGRIWRMVDTDKISAKKTYVEFDLAQLLKEPDATLKASGLALFAFFFGKDSYVNELETQTTPIRRAIQASDEFALAVEENLKAVIYGYSGEDSLFETMGRAIHKANPKASLAQVYENSVVLLFRLLFIVYFEDKNAVLLKKHPFYPRHSLNHIFQSLRDETATRKHLHDGIFALKHLFDILDCGAGDIDIPLFNGGLFDHERAPLLLTPKIFDNATLQQILEKLRYKSHRGDTLFDTRRDFKSISVTHLGRIYEGLLEFRFERATESAVYLEYESASTKGKTVEAYFDGYDSANIRKEKGFRAWKEVSLKKGDFYLKNANNSRKASASYYTPSSLSQPLVSKAIDRALESGAQPAVGKAIMSLKILDNACGSGHFLVEALGYLTDLALAQLETDADLQFLVSDESEKISAQLQALNLDYQPDDAQILKRALLKRCIFGVDLNPFAVELARLSLWMDSFIFGTPLSFIEHHIQHGNALMGASKADLIAYNARDAQQRDLFSEDLGARFEELGRVMQDLDAMRDTTPEEIAQSKALWKDITPRLNLLSRALSFICTRRILLAEGNSIGCEALDKTPDLIKQLFSDSSVRSAALRQIEACAKKYHFFHFEVAFPEAFAGGRNGFDIVIGNPPWDKTKFSDTDFFPQYHSNYRSLKNTEKSAVQTRLLGSAHIAAAYKTAERSMEIANNYFKAAFPLNKGSGDGNLFRFFVERNLGLVGSNGSLNYVLPSALMFEEGSKALREHIFSQHQLQFFYSFENRNALFPAVDSRYKFALMQIAHGTPQSVDALSIDTAFYLTDPAELHKSDRRIPYPLKTLKALSPVHWAMMELRDGMDLPILEKCYRQFPALSQKWLDFRRELDMTNDKDLFVESANSNLLPLFEGKMIWQFSHSLETPQYWLDRTGLEERLQSKELFRMAQDLDVPKSKVSKYVPAIRYDHEFIRLGFRDIASDTNERTLIFSLVPKNVGVGNTINIGIPKYYVRMENSDIAIKVVSSLRLLFSMAWFNSIPVDWLARFMIQIHANKTYLYRLPMPQPEDAEIYSNADYAQLAKNALLLSLAASWDDFAELAPLFDVNKKDLPQTAKAADMLRAQNDRLVAKLYGISDDEFARLLRSFPGMAKKRPEYLVLLAA